MAAPFHFFASSASGWCAREEISPLLRAMKKGGDPFRLWYVPLPLAIIYAVTRDGPDVEGATLMGRYGGP